MTAEMDPEMEIEVENISETSIFLDQSKINREFNFQETAFEKNDDEKNIKMLLEELTTKVAVEFDQNTVVLSENDDSNVLNIMENQEIGASPVLTPIISELEDSYEILDDEKQNKNESFVEIEPSSELSPNGTVKKRGPGRPPKRKRRRTLDCFENNNLVDETFDEKNLESAEGSEPSESCSKSMPWKKGRYSTLETTEYLRKQFEDFSKTSLDELPKKRHVEQTGRFSPLPVKRQQKLLVGNTDDSETPKQKEMELVKTEPSESPIKTGKKRGRKSKAELAAIAAETAANSKSENSGQSKNDLDQSTSSIIERVKRKRGRPKKKPIIEQNVDYIYNDDELDLNSYRRSSEAGMNSETDQSASNINQTSDSQTCLQFSELKTQISGILAPFLRQLDEKITSMTEFMQEQAQKMNEVCDKFNSVGAEELIVPHN